MLFPRVRNGNSAFDYCRDCVETQLRNKPKFRARVWTGPATEDREPPQRFERSSRRARGRGEHALVSSNGLARSLAHKCSRSGRTGLPRVSSHRVSFQPCRRRGTSGRGSWSGAGEAADAVAMEQVAALLDDFQHPGAGMPHELARQVKQAPAHGGEMRIIAFNHRRPRRARNPDRYR